MTAALHIMKKVIKLCVNAKFLVSNEEALKNVAELLSEFEEKGFLEDGQIVFDSTQEDDVKEIFERHMPLNSNYKTETK